MPRSITKRGFDLLISCEGMRLEAYRDSAGLLTIGVGHLLTRSELSSGKLLVRGEPLRWADGITRKQALDLLDVDLDVAEEAVERLAPNLPDHRFDALVSFVFNVGVGAFERSTLLARLRGGDLEAVPAQLRRWNRAAGVVVAGLVARREREAALWGAA